MERRAENDSPNGGNEAVFLDLPRDPQLLALYQYWQKLRGDRAMPLRTELDPTRFPKLLPHIILYNVETPGGPYTIRLVGEEIRRFMGQIETGRRAGVSMGARATEAVVAILDAVVSGRAPIFRAGKAYWHLEKSYRDFEACYLPLAAVDGSVTVVLLGMKFPP